MQSYFRWNYYVLWILNKIICVIRIIYIVIQRQTVSLYINSILFDIKSKVGDRSQGPPEHFVFNSSYAEV